MHEGRSKHTFRHIMIVKWASERVCGFWYLLLAFLLWILMTTMETIGNDPSRQILQSRSRRKEHLGQSAVYHTLLCDNKRSPWTVIDSELTAKRYLVCIPHAHPTLNLFHNLCIKIIISSQSNQNLYSSKRTKILVYCWRWDTVFFQAGCHHMGLSKGNRRIGTWKQTRIPRYFGSITGTRCTQTFFPRMLKAPNLTFSHKTVCSSQPPTHSHFEESPQNWSLPQDWLFDSILSIGLPC